MTTKYLYYDPATGRVTHETKDLNPTATQPFVEVTGDTLLGLTHHVANGVLVNHGTPPTRFHAFDYNTKQWTLDTSRAWAEVRSKRAQILKDSDYTQLSDSPKNKQKWATYRQALRDITNQADPSNIVWPVEPV